MSLWTIPYAVAAVIGAAMVWRDRRRFPSHEAWIRNILEGSTTEES